MSYFETEYIGKNSPSIYPMGQWDTFRLQRSAAGTGLFAAYPEVLGRLFISPVSLYRGRNQGIYFLEMEKSLKTNGDPAWEEAKNVRDNIAPIIAAHLGRIIARTSMSYSGYSGLTGFFYVR
jgi:hypothetical protein